MSLKVTAVGTQSDLASGTDITKVAGGYFGNIRIATEFCEIGIGPQLSDFPEQILYADFGGGPGLLADAVRSYLQLNGKGVQTTVLDANELFLADAKKLGIETLLCNIESVAINDLDLVTMRSVLHYNDRLIQLQILQNVFRSLKAGGRFVHQVCSSPGTESATLRSAVVNLPSLGRAGAGTYYWCNEEEALRMHQKVGFRHVRTVGHAAPCIWSPEELWERFNGKKENTPEKDVRMRTFLKQANELIEAVQDKESAGIEVMPVGRFNVHYTFPIIVGQK